MTEYRPTYVRKDGTEIFMLRKDLATHVIAAVVAQGHKPSKALLAFEKELEEPLEMTRAEFERFYRKVEMTVLMEATPEERRELMRDMDTCPCCERWMGHNRPPADDAESDRPYRRQTSFDFDRPE